MTAAGHPATVRAMAAVRRRWSVYLVRTAAGALYTHELFPKSVNAVRINLDHGSARLFYWRLSAAKYEWVRDLDFHREGSVQVPLTPRLRSKMPGRAPSAIA